MNAIAQQQGNVIEMLPSDQKPIADPKFEAAFLGSILIDPIWGCQYTQIPPEAFYTYEHQAVWKAILSIVASGQLPDMTRTAITCHDMGMKDPRKLIGLLMDGVSGSHSHDLYAEKVLDLYKRRRLDEFTHQIKNAVRSKNTDWAIKLQSECNDIFNEVGTGNGLLHLSARFDQSIQREECYETGLKSLDRLAGAGFSPGKLISIAGRPAMGKAQPFDSNVLLSTGEWKLMGDIEIGDKLASVDGKESIVWAIHPQGERQIYRVTLSDGRSIECDIEHLWQVQSSRFKGQKTLTTREIIELLKTDRYQAGRLRLVGHSGEFGTKTLPVDPWLVGFLLGDGCLTQGGVCFSNPEEYILNRVAESSGMEVRSGTSLDHRIYSGKNIPHPVRNHLSELGMIGKKAPDKMIPDMVWQCDRHTRISILAGLLESDGWVEKFNSVQFSSSSKNLAEGVVRLVHSLGGVATIRVKTDIKYVHNGEKKSGLDAYTVSVVLDSLFDVIRSPRLLKNMKQRKSVSLPSIFSIEPSRKAEAKCITVTHESQLYITDGYCVTHNSAFVSWLACALCNTFVKQGTNKEVAFFSLEMRHEDMIHRILSPIVQIPFNEIRERGAQGDKRILAAREVMPNIPIWVSDYPTLTWEAIVAQTTAMAASGNLGAVIIDHLHHLIPESGPEGVAVANKAVPAFARMAKKLDVPVFLVCQLNRNTEGRTDKIPTLADIREFYVVEQQSAMMLMLYRDEYYNPETDKRGVTLIRCAKNRYGPTGDVEVLGNLAYSTYLDMT